MDSMGSLEKLGSYSVYYTRAMARAAAVLESCTEELKELAKSLSEATGISEEDAAEKLRYTTQCVCGSYESLIEWAEKAMAELSKFSDGIASLLSGDFLQNRKQKWPRPKNDRLKPLLLDRRPKLYRCRNNC